MNFTRLVREEILEKKISRGDEAAAELIGYLSMREEERGEAEVSAIVEPWYKERMRTMPTSQEVDVVFDGEECWCTAEGNLYTFASQGDMALRKAYLRGAFLATGSIRDPNKGYHAELSCKNHEAAACLVDILRQEQIHAKILLRDAKKFMVYIKEASSISDLLTMLGAIRSTLAFEEALLTKAARNNINRKVNCETANLSKTISAGMRQVRAIEHLKEQGTFPNLEPALYRTGLLRLANPDASLEELVMLSGEDITKSGMNHRLKKLLELGEEDESTHNK